MLLTDAGPRLAGMAGGLLVLQEDRRAHQRRYANGGAERQPGQQSGCNGCDGRRDREQKAGPTGSVVLAIRIEQKQPGRYGREEQKSHRHPATGGHAQAGPQHDCRCCRTGQQGGGCRVVRQINEVAPQVA